MQANILCTLLAQRINPEQFQLWGLDVHWMKEEYDTPENRAIVADVIANYDTLAAQYEAEQEKIAFNKTIYAELDEIDKKSIRAIRAGDTEYIVEFEAEAKAERAKLK